jgi:hypothetical protein
MCPDRIRAFQIFERASEYVATAGLVNEIRWQRQSSLESFTESEFLRESAWVIMCSGFRESVVRRLFDQLSLCFCDWESASSIARNSTVCKWSASAVFGNGRKLDAIASVSQTISRAGFVRFKRSVLTDPISQLQKLSYIGPVTAWHLAKNLGMDVAKPDRHLLRVSTLLGFKDVLTFCSEIAAKFNEETKVVDLIVWRYLADNPVCVAGLEQMHLRAR